MKISLGLLVLRIGIGFVFCFFGFDKFPHSADWVIYIPAGLFGAIAKISGLTIQTILRIQGLAELVIGIHLLLGFKTRITAGVGVVFLVLIISVLEWGHVAVRDVGLLGASLAIVFLGSGEFSLDAWLGKRGHKQ